MIISFSTLASTLFLNSIAIIILYFFVRNKALVFRTSIFFLYLCMFFALLRPVIPIELPFTKTIPIERIWPTIYRFIHQPLFDFADIEVSLLTILAALWITGAIIYCLRIVIAYSMLCFRITRMPPCTDSLIIEILDKVNIIYKKKITFKVVISEFNTPPFIFGVRHPYIVLPAVKLSAKEWNYILQHEVAHYHYGDLLKKVIIELVSAAFWWNPYLFMIKKKMDGVMEMYIDSIVTSTWSNEDKIAYMECIIKLARMNETGMLGICKKHVVYDFASDLSIKQRIEFLINSVTNKYKPTIIMKIIMLLLMLFILFAPSFYVFEPKSILPEHAEGIFMITSENAYFVLNDEGKYDIYLNGEYIYTLVEPDIDGLTIYNTKGEVILKEKNPAK